MHSVEPLYIASYELGDTAGKNIQLELCCVCERLVPGQLAYAQIINGVWSLWFKTKNARSHMLNTIKTIEVNKNTIELLSTYPTAKPVPNEKIMFRDIPPSVPDADILKFLHSQPGIQMKSGVIHARIRDHQNKLTNFFSGDRFVYVKGNFTPALHYIGNIDLHRCRIWHKSQSDACERCRSTTHRTHATDKCAGYTEDRNVVSIKSPNFPMCNYFPCVVKIYGLEFPSSEHAFHWRFLTYIGMHDLAEEVRSATSAAEAKAVSSRVPRHMRQDWHSINTAVMKDILHAKADCSPVFKKSLLESTGKRLVEAVRGDIFWSSGLSPFFAATTKQEYYPGGNKLGSILESVRLDLVKEAVLYDELTDDQAPQCNPSVMSTMHDDKLIQTSTHISLSDTTQPSHSQSHHQATESTSSYDGIHVAEHSVPSNTSMNNYSSIRGVKAKAISGQGDRRKKTITKRQHTKPLRLNYLSSVPVVFWMRPLP